jgi:hypothetical protein
VAHPVDQAAALGVVGVLCRPLVARNGRQHRRRNAVLGVKALPGDAQQSGHTRQRPAVAAGNVDGPLLEPWQFTLAQGAKGDERGAWVVAEQVVEQ